MQLEEFSHLAGVLSKRSSNWIRRVYKATSACGWVIHNMCNALWCSSIQNSSVGSPLSKMGAEVNAVSRDDIVNA